MLKYIEMSAIIEKSKEALQDYISPRDVSDIEDYKRLMTFDDDSFFCYLAAINISSGYHLILNNWLFKELTDSKEFYSDFVFSGNLLVELMPMLRRRLISILPEIKNFEIFFTKSRKKEFDNNGPKLIKSKSHTLNIQNYLDFVLFCANPYDSFILNIKFRTHVVTYFDAIRFETREHVHNGTNNLHYLILLVVLFDFHNTLFEERFRQSKDKSMDQRAEVLFAPYYDIINSKI